MDKKERFDAIQEADRAGHVAYCRELCETFLRELPDHWPALVSLASQLTALHLYRESESAIDRAAKVVSANQRHWVQAELGHLLRARGRFVDAEVAFLQAHESDPDDAGYLIFAGSAAANQGEIERALEHYTKATQCRDGYVDEAHFNRGGKLLALKRYQEAAEAYREALRIDPDYELAKRRLLDIELLLAHQDLHGKSITPK
jgi:tetratricopeptide (TPR) repeat protein